MSMLDSYQHHYLLSLVLGCFVFFPRLSGERALLWPGKKASGKGAKKKRASEKAASEKAASKKAAKRKGKKGRGKRKKAGTGTGTGASEAPLRKLWDPGPLTTAWAYTLLAGSIAVVYAYTAFSKTDPEWLSGAALRNVVHLGLEAPPAGAEDPIGPFRNLLAIFGIEGEPLWYLLGHSVVVVQIICAAGYLLSPLRDAIRSRAAEVFFFVALLTALSFHLGAEYMDLKIGWFSWYMVGYAVFFFLPARWLVVLARVFVPLRGISYGPEVIAARGATALVLVLIGLAADMWPLAALGAFLGLVGPVRYLTRALWLKEASGSPPDGVIYGEVALACVLMIGAGRLVDLPGAALASVIVAGGLVAGLAVVRWRTGEVTRVAGYAVGIGLSALALYASVASSEVRWDYYRNVGGDHRRRGEIEEAYVAYVKANRYAPEGEDRREREDEMRAALEAEGRPVPEVE